MLRLRPCKLADGRFLLTWLADERTVEFWRADRFTWPLTQGQLDTYFRDFEADQNAMAFTALDARGHPCGHFSFRNISWEENRAHMGFIVVDPAARGMGYGRRMVRQALRYAFGCLGLSAVTLGVYDCNEPARRCYEAEGFVRIDREGFKAGRESHADGEWEYFYMEAKAGQLEQ
ncbi:GNAT family N-acetyltransferase [Otoolea muris]|uniref:GNAT family N-acetyltransferase n=1 Tax=Otoolea muris TaxID=2941515 RepID=UPI00204031E7|nr:GNAT family protein [Otoolea muris]